MGQHSDAGGQDWLGLGKETGAPLLPAQPAFAGTFFCPPALGRGQHGLRATAGNATLSLGRLPSARSAGCGRPECPADGPHCCALPQVRVFTFSVGQHNYDVTPLQWMACANKGERGWHLAGTGGCRVLGSPLARGLAPVLQCMPLPGRCWLQPWRPGQQDSQTAGQTDSWLSSCLSLSFPRLLL